MKKLFAYDPAVARFQQDGETITMLSLLLPMLCEKLFLLLYGTVNTLVISGYSQEAVSAISVSTQVKNLALVIITMVIKGSTIITSVALGSQNLQRAKQVSGAGSYLTVITGALLGAVMFFWAEPILRLMNLEGEMVAMAASYLRMCGVFLPITALYSCLNNLLITNGQSKCIMVIGVAGNLVNVLLSYGALYSNVVLPVSDVSAIGLAAGISQVLCLTAAVWFFWKKRCPFQWGIRWEHVQAILRLGVPSGMANFSWTLAQTITTGFITPLGMIAINTKVYISNITNYVANASFAFGSANAVLMGRHRGAGNLQAVKTLYGQNLRIAILGNCALALLCFVFRNWLVGLFTKDTAVLQMATIIMLIDIPLEIGRGINHIAEGALNANGDVKTTLIMSVISCWGCSVLLGYVLCNLLGWGLIGVWLGFAADELLRGVAYWLYWQSGKWATKKI